MKERLLDLLGCPTCGGDILLAYASKYDDKEIIDAVLTCKKCDREYKVIRGVPRFADLDKIEQDKAETAENFGWQWTHFTQEDEKSALGQNLDDSRADFAARTQAPPLLPNRAPRRLGTFSNNHGELQWAAGFTRLTGRIWDRILSPSVWDRIRSCPTSRLGDLYEK